MANQKIEIINYFDNLINQVDIDTEESFEKYNEEQVIGDLKCYKSYKKKEKYKNLFEMSELPLNKSYEKKHPWQNVEDKIEEMLLKHQTIENPDDLEFNKIYKTVDLWSESTKVFDYLNQVRMRTIEELREAQKEALESYKSQSDDSKRQLFPEKFYFQVRYTQKEPETQPEEWIFKLFTFATDFNMSSVEISFLEKLINAKEREIERLYHQDFDVSDKNVDHKRILIGLFQKFFFENLNSEKFPSPVISVYKRDLLAIKQISFHYSVYGFYLANSSSIDLSNLESLEISPTFEQIDIDGLSSLESLSLTLNSLGYSSLNNLPSLRNLDIYIFDPIEGYSQDLFYNLPSIEYLTLSVPFDDYKYLSHFSLDSLVNLKGLSLTGTMHEDFNFDLFKNICDHLEIISLDFQNFDNECLEKLFYGHQFPILKSFSIYLSYMLIEITKLEKKFFNGFPMLQSLTINNSEGLRVIDFNVFSNLKHLISLDLSNSYIDSLDVMLFSGLINLKYLNLCSNRLKRVPTYQFAYLTNLRLLDLSNNQLCNFELRILNYTKKIEFIDLSNNTIANKDEILNRIKGSNIKFNF